MTQLQQTKPHISTGPTIIARCLLCLSSAMVIVATFQPWGSWTNLMGRDDLFGNNTGPVRLRITSGFNREPLCYLNANEATGSFSVDIVDPDTKKTIRCRTPDSFGWPLAFVAGPVAVLAVLAAGIRFRRTFAIVASILVIATSIGFVWFIRAFVGPAKVLDPYLPMNPSFGLGYYLFWTAIPCAALAALTAYFAHVRRVSTPENAGTTASGKICGCLLIFVCLSTCTCLLRADEVKKKDGTVLTGRIIEETETQVVLEQPDGARRLVARVAIESIQRSLLGPASTRPIARSTHTSQPRPDGAGIPSRPPQGAPVARAPSVGDGEQQNRPVWPRFRQLIPRGENEVRIVNPDKKISVTVGLRSGESGRDLSVPAGGTRSLFVQDGGYDIYFQYADEPNALYQGDSFSLSDNGVEIQLVSVVNGNYGIRRVE